MAVEDAADRAALLADFGLLVRFSPPSGAVELVGILDAPTREVSGIGSELDFLEPAPSLLIRTEDLGELRVEDPIEVLEGALAGSYLARYWFAEDFRVSRMSRRVARQRGLLTEQPIYRIVRVLPRAGKGGEPLVREWQRHPKRVR